MLPAESFAFRRTRLNGLCPLGVVPLPARHRFSPTGGMRAGATPAQKNKTKKQLQYYCKANKWLKSSYLEMVRYQEAISKKRSEDSSPELLAPTFLKLRDAHTYGAE